MMLPDVPGLMAELVAPTYTFQNGQFLLEDKDQIKKRIGRSPDLADALALTFTEMDMPMGLRNYGQAGARGHAASDWDPLTGSDRTLGGGQVKTDWDPFA
jgi:hypothetical protein